MRRVVSLLHNVLWERMGDWFRERGLKGGNSVDNIFELLFVRSFQRHGGSEQGSAAFSVRLKTVYAEERQTIIHSVQ